MNWVSNSFSFICIIHKSMDIRVSQINNRDTPLAKGPANRIWLWSNINYCNMQILGVYQITYKYNSRTLIIGLLKCEKICMHVAQPSTNSYFLE